MSSWANRSPGRCLRAHWSVEPVGRDAETVSFTLTYREVIHNESSLAGRLTKVPPRATSPKWEGVDLVKIYWPEVCGASEIEFLRKAIKEAKKEAKSNLLPRVGGSQSPRECGHEGFGGYRRRGGKTD